MYKGTPIRLSADFTAEILQARKKRYNIFKIMKGKHLQLRILNPARYNSDLKERSNVLQTSKS